MPGNAATVTKTQGELPVNGTLGRDLSIGDDFLGLFGLVIRDDMLVMLDGGSPCIQKCNSVTA